MFGKLALFVVVALCATQGLQAYSADPESRAIQDIINGIKDIIKKVETAVADIINKIPNMIKNLKDKITDIINKIDVGGIVGKIQDKIQAILAAAGIDVTAARKCIDIEKADVDKLIQEASASVAQCKKTADDRTEELAAEMEELKTKAHDLITEIKSGMEQCLKDHGLNPIQLVKCMTTHFTGIKEKADALVKQIADTISIATKTAADITLTLAKCTANITSNLLVGQKKIIEDFQKCVNELKQ